MHANRVGPARARIELGIVIGEQALEFDAPQQRVAPEADILAERRELLIRRADARAFEIVDVEIRQQMKSRLSCTTSIRSMRL